MTINMSLRQIELTRDQLGAGLASMSSETVPESVQLVVHPEPVDFEQRLDIRFQETFDNLDRTQIAILETGTGIRIALLRHLGAPTKGTEIAVIDGAVNQMRIDALIREVGLSNSDVLWRKSARAEIPGPRRQASAPKTGDYSLQGAARLKPWPPKSKADELSQRIADLVRENDVLRRRVAELASGWKKIETALAGATPRSKSLARRSSAKSAVPRQRTAPRNSSRRQKQSREEAPTDTHRAAR